MRVVVCAKQVPDVDGPPQLDPATHRLDRSGRLALDPADAVGVETALRLAKEGDEVVLASMSPARDVGGLRSALAMGAHRAVLVSDDALAGADSLVTATVLAAAARRTAPYDVIVAGTESSDGYTGVLPTQLAALLDLPAVTFARRVEVMGGRLRAERQTEHGTEDVECDLPCVLTVTSGAVTPRYTSYKAIVGARAKPIEVLGLADLGVACPDAIGQEVVYIATAPPRGAGEVVEDDGTGHARIVELLVRLKVI